MVFKSVAFPFSQHVFTYFCTFSPFLQWNDSKCKNESSVVANSGLQCLFSFKTVFAISFITFVCQFNQADFWPPMETDWNDLTPSVVPSFIITNHFLCETK
jgi:hypothetical protein